MMVPRDWPATGSRWVVCRSRTVVRSLFLWTSTRSRSVRVSVLVTVVVGGGDRGYGEGLLEVHEGLDSVRGYFFYRAGELQVQQYWQEETPPARAGGVLGLVCRVGGADRTGEERVENLPPLLSVGHFGEDDGREFDVVHGGVQDGDGDASREGRVVELQVRVLN